MQKGSIDIDLGKESSGIYFVKINSEKGATTKKIVLNNPD
jgi:hypothetical protein